MKNIVSLFLNVIIYATAFAQVNSVTKTNPLLVDLKDRVSRIDQLADMHRGEMLTLISIANKKKVIKVKNEDWPDNTEYIYQILKDGKGKVVLTNQVPYSQSGDWYEEFRHYYDDNGNVIAIRKKSTVFDDSVKGGVVMKITLKYYGPGHKEIYNSEQLTDKDQKSLNRKADDFDLRDDKFVIYKNLAQCLAGYHISI